MSPSCILETLVAWSLFGVSSTASIAQIFQDWPADSILVTDHVLGYLGHGVSFCDFDGDGLDDLTFGHYNGQLYAYQSQGDGTFLPFDLGIGNTSGEIKAVVWVDVDGDDDLDLFVTQRLAPNRLWIRDPEGALVEVPNAGGLAGGSNERTYGTSWGDYDRDGDLDVYCCKFHAAPVNTESNRLYQNLGGVDLNVNFSDVTETAGVGNGVKRRSKVPGLTSTTTAGLTSTSSTTAPSSRTLFTSTSKTGRSKTFPWKLAWTWASTP